MKPGPGGRGERLGGGQHVGEVGRLVSDGVDVEEDRARDMALDETVAAVPRLTDQRQGGVDHTDRGIAHASRKPGCGDQGIAHDSQLGTGRPFSRRKDGLKIFDWYR